MLTALPTSQTSLPSCVPALGRCPGAALALNPPMLCLQAKDKMYRVVMRLSQLTVFLKAGMTGGLAVWHGLGKSAST